MKRLFHHLVPDPQSNVSDESARVTAEFERLRKAHDKALEHADAAFREGVKLAEEIIERRDDA